MNDTPLKNAIVISTFYESEKSKKEKDDSSSIDTFSGKVGEAASEFTKGSIRTGRALGGAAGIAFKALKNKYNKI